MLCLKKPMSGSRLLLLLLVLALLIPMLAACQPRQTASDKVSHEPLSEETIKEIRTAWEADPPIGTRDFHYAFDYASPENYYGTYGDCIALFYGYDPNADAESFPCLKVADSYFCYNAEFKIVVYREGEFAHLPQAYQDGWLTEEQVEFMAEHHRSVNYACVDHGYYMEEKNE